MNMEIFATIQAITNARVILSKISTPILLVLGNVGEILSIMIFVQRTFRTNSCAIYFLAASCARLFFINFTILLVGLELGFNIDPSPTSLIFCKIKFYLSYVTSILPPSLVVLACIDRFMLSSLNVNNRWWSTPRFAYRMIAGVSIFWIIFSIHAFFGSNIYQINGYSYCSFENGFYVLFITLYSVIIAYSLPPILMIIFGLLTIINVRQTQRRIRRTAARGPVQRKDQYLIRMLLFQILANVSFTLPMAGYQIYVTVSLNWQKDLLQQTWEYFVISLCLMMFFVPHCTSFYIYTLTASIFREELKRIITQRFHRFFPRRQAQVNTITIALNQSLY